MYRRTFLHEASDIGDDRAQQGDQRLHREPVGELVARLGAIGFADRAPDEREIDVKLRLAKAYVDVNRLRAAQQILHEVRREGAPRYRRFAEDQLASPTGPAA